MTHPALALVRCGAIPDAIALLRERGDHPPGLALLEAGFTDFALHVLATVAPTRPSNDAALGDHPASPAFPAAGDTARRAPDDLDLVGGVAVAVAGGGGGPALGELAPPPGRAGAAKAGQAAGRGARASQHDVTPGPGPSVAKGPTR